VHTSELRKMKEELISAPHAVDQDDTSHSFNIRKRSTFDDPRRSIAAKDRKRAALKHVDRSQSAPVVRKSHSSPPLRRAFTSPVHGGPSSHLQVLREALHVVESEGSQMQSDEVLAAVEIVHRMGGVLNNQLGRRLGSPEER